MKLNQKMATRNDQANYVPYNECTEFSIHTSRKDVLDFTAGKLNQLWQDERNNARKIELAILYEDYISCKIAVAFSKGLPVYIKVTKNE